MADTPRFIPLEKKVAPLPIDTTKAPVITECLATGCLSLDLDVMEGAGGRTWIVACGNGHMAFLTRLED